MTDIQLINALLDSAEQARKEQRRLMIIAAARIALALSESANKLLKEHSR